MKNYKTINMALVFILSMIANQANSALVTGTVLAFESTSYTNICTVGGTYPNCDFDISSIEVDVNGSWSGFDLQLDGVIDPLDRVEIIPGVDGGVVLGELQILNEIEQSWSFLGVPSSGHYTTSPITVVNDLGLTKELDFSAWAFGRGDGLDFPLGGNAGLGDTGLASLTCESIECANGEHFILSYVAHLPSDFGDGYDEMLYELHLQGTISAVPVPAAVWLFGSGLLSLIGYSRRKK